MIDFPERLFGMRVITTPALPLIPTIEQEAKWIVQQAFRKEYRDFARWYRTPLERKPEITHAIIMDSPKFGQVIAISHQAYVTIRCGYDFDGRWVRDAATTEIVNSIWGARNDYYNARGRL